MGARDGQVAMITGGASGFGAAVARTLAGEGMRVCLVEDRKSTRLNSSHPV